MQGTIVAPIRDSGPGFQLDPGWTSVQPGDGGPPAHSKLGSRGLLVQVDDFIGGMAGASIHIHVQEQRLIHHMWENSSYLGDEASICLLGGLGACLGPRSLTNGPGSDGQCAPAAEKNILLPCSHRMS